MFQTKSPLALLCVLLITLCAATVAVAQSQATTGNIEGRVTDPNGAAVAGVNITATNQDTAFEKTGASDTDGNFLIAFLPPGKYRVITSGSQGFASTEYRNVIVTVGGKTPLDTGG